MATEVLADDRALRTGRRERALAQMEKHDLDVLVLGRQANVRYVSGAPQLWVAGTRPFGPTCVVIRETGAIHLLSTWDEGVPDDIPHENLYGIAWNPMNTISVLKGIDGATLAEQVRHVFRGGKSLSPESAEKLAYYVAARKLSERELEIIGLISKGQSNKEIGKLLFVTENTVKMHVKNILSKLEASDRTQAVVIAIQRGLLDA